MELTDILNLHRLRPFRAVATDGTLTGAARSCCSFATAADWAGMLGDRPRYLYFGRQSFIGRTGAIGSFTARSAGISSD